MRELRTFRDTLVELLSAFKRKMLLHYLYTAWGMASTCPCREQLKKSSQLEKGLTLPWM